jgi:hypothetical protein
MSADSTPQRHDTIRRARMVRALIDLALTTRRPCMLPYRRSAGPAPAPFVRGVISVSGMPAGRRRYS